MEYFLNTTPLPQAIPYSAIRTFQPATYTISAESLPFQPVCSVLLLHTTIKYRCYEYYGGAGIEARLRDGTS